MAGRIRKGGAKFLGFNALVLTTVGRKTGAERATPVGWFPGPGRQLADRRVGGGASGNPAWYYDVAARPNQVQIEVEGRKGGGGRRAAPRDRARPKPGSRSPGGTRSPSTSEDRPGAADHPPSAAIRLRRHRKAEAGQFSPAGRQAGSRPVNPMSRSSSGAESGTATGGPNSPGLPSGFCATADRTNAYAAWTSSVWAGVVLPGRGGDVPAVHHDLVDRYVSAPPRAGPRPRLGSGRPQAGLVLPGAGQAGEQAG